MFTDPLTNLFLVILLFFAGLLVMFFFIMRTMEFILRSHEETRKQLSVTLADLESKLAELAFAVKAEKGEGSVIKNTPESLASLNSHSRTPSGNHNIYQGMHGHSTPQSTAPLKTSAPSMVPPAEHGINTTQHTEKHAADRKKAPAQAQGHISQPLAQAPANSQSTKQPVNHPASQAANQATPQPANQTEKQTTSPAQAPAEPLLQPNMQPASSSAAVKPATSAPSSGAVNSAAQMKSSDSNALIKFDNAPEQAPANTGGGSAPQLNTPKGSR